ncbi:MAG: hypothetical protein R3242_07135 [Akkermansiaceae bacterium]|nr:hypothetical protein [Akkermansiaceae bacterium]
MIRRLFISLACSLTPLGAEPAGDLLRFSNGDQLHGRFLGISEGPKLQWQREDLQEVAEFNPSNLRHAVLRNGSPAAPLDSTSVVELVNGDRLPGTITALDESQVTVETSCAGTITLDRNLVSKVAPQPHGGRLHYHGPFSEDPWQVNSYKSGDADQLRSNILQARGVGGKIGGQGEAREAGEAPLPDWRHSGAAWYWKSDEPGSALILRDAMPKRSTLRFDLAWKNKLMVAIAVHADFCTEEKLVEAEEADAPGNAPLPEFSPHSSNNLPNIFGNAYILQLHSNYLVIYRTVVMEDGTMSKLRVRKSSSRLKLEDRSKATLEIRSDLENSTCSFFVDGNFICQWRDPALKQEGLEPVDGSSFAIMPITRSGPLRLSDMVLAEWNGMPDSARSLENEEQDIVLMTNGLDRFSGKAIALESGTLRFKGRHGEFMLPIHDIAELRFATNERLKPEPPSGLVMTMRFSPMGRITGTPVSGDRETLRLRHPLAGELDIRNDAAVMFEFNETTNIFTDWDDNF